MNFNGWIERNSNCASYDHFDNKVSLKDVINEIKDPKIVSKHSFKPFIHYEKITKKFDSNTKKHKVKIRQINYASHMDRCIYLYYGYLINEKYNLHAKKKNINKVAIAYRNNLHKNNIHFAKQAFNFIKDNPSCVVFIGDFTNFFDTLDHNYLKDKLQTIMDTDKLPEDLYKVFKSITKYSFVNKNELESIKSQLELSYRNMIMPMKELRNFPGVIHCNNSGQGVAQGVSISAILSNVYMMDFDEECNKLVGQYKGLYLRYSDDFILVFPNSKIMDTNRLYNMIIEKISKIPNLSLSKEKTKIYYCDNKLVKNCEKEIGKDKNGLNFIDYLGFTYDGNKVKIRDKTVGKYYYRLYKKIKTINYQNENSMDGGGKEKLYTKYSLKGANKGNGNFITYVQRCINVFGYNENVHVVLNKHYGKIKKRLK